MTKPGFTPVPSTVTWAFLAARSSCSAASGWWSQGKASSSQVDTTWQPARMISSSVGRTSGSRLRVACSTTTPSRPRRAWPSDALISSRSPGSPTRAPSLLPRQRGRGVHRTDQLDLASRRRQPGPAPDR